jgi:succinyldiaminopimelate transaminase
MRDDIDLRIGSPVDPVPSSVKAALERGYNAHRYISARGLPECRAACANWYRTTRGVEDIDDASVLPVAGTKMLIGLLPLWLGLDSSSVIVIPRLHYPTYEAGAALVGAQVIAEDDVERWPENASLIWLNSPRNPDGAINGRDYLQRAIERARQLNAIIVQDECYSAFDWACENDGPTASILSIPGATRPGGRVLALYSMSKQSNMAGYRAGFVAGDPSIIEQLGTRWGTYGLVLSQPVQYAMIDALANTEAVSEQRRIHARRRLALQEAFKRWGMVFSEDNVGGFFLWGHAPGENAESVVQRLADLGILTRTGAAYGDETHTYVRISITVSDAQVADAVERLNHDADRLV